MAALTVNEERATIADLEAYGLSLRAINSLEDGLGLLYVDELSQVTEGDLRKMPYFGPRTAEELRQALRNWLDGRIVKTPDDCARIF